MKRNHLAITLLILSSLAASFSADTAHAFTPAYLWGRSYGGSFSDYGRSIATDPSGNVFMTGYFDGTADFGGGGLTANGTDIVLAKYSASGTLLWNLKFGGSYTDQGFSVATDAAGFVFMTGSYAGNVNFGGGALTSAGLADIVLIKYSPIGTHVWSRRFGGTGNDRGYCVATDASGNVFLTGYFSGTVDFGGGPLVSAGSLDMFIAEYSSDGTYLWSRRFGDAGDDQGRSVSTDTSGNVFVTGYFNGTVDFGGGALASAGLTDGFIAKYDSGGTHLWSRRFGDTGNDQGYSVATDASGDVLATGYFNGSVDFGGGALVSAGKTDAFIARYGPGGSHLWSQRFGDTENDQGLSIATDAAGDAFLAGSFAGSVDFGGGALTSVGGADIVVAAYDPTGTFLWSHGFGGTLDDYPYSITTDALGDAFMIGTFLFTMDLPDGTLTSAGVVDIVVAKYGAGYAEPAITNITDVANDQGGRVYVDFVRSGLDMADAARGVSGYNLYRRIDDPTSIATVHDPGASTDTEELPAPDGAALPPGSWALLGSAYAIQSETYRMEATTAADSGVTGTNDAVFLVTAHTVTPSEWYASAPDSGYSVDNLAPGIPANLVYDAGLLSWDESTAEDFQYFTVYGADVDDFGMATLVDYTITTDMDVTAAGYVYYFVTATDFAGNEGAPGEINTLVGAGDTPRSYVLSVSNFPNPFNPTTTVRYTVPIRGNVTVAIYDARGARVATLVNNEVLGAGAYRTEWNGRLDSGRPVASGIYFARIEQHGAVRTQKMVLLK